jgi:hypothetical protein
MMKWKTSRILLTCIALLFFGFYAGVAFLGQNWSDQARYLLTLLGLLLTIVVCAAVLLLLFKLVGKLWDLLVARQSAEFNIDPDQAPGDEPPSNKQE